LGSVSKIGVLKQSRFANIHVFRTVGGAVPEIAVMDTVECSNRFVSRRRRSQHIAATHLLQAPKFVDLMTLQGSLVISDRLRFDFNLEIPWFNC
jgi:alanyl-tRNA synthetase